MLNALGLGILFQAKDELSEVIEKLHGGMEHLKEASEKTHLSITALLSTGGKLAGVAAGIAAIAAGGAFEFAEHAEKFSSAIRRAGVAAHATGEEMEAFERMAKTQALDSLKDSAIGVAEGLEQLALEGYNLQQSGEALDATLQLMRISMGALGAKEAAGVVHDTLSEFHMSAGQAGEMVDKLAFAMQHFGFRAEELAPAMSGLASGANLAKASLDDTLIGVGLIKNVFPSATKAASAMNVALQQLAGTHTQKELAGIGVNVRDLHGNMKPLLNIMQDLSTKTAHMSEAQLAHRLATIGSARAAGGLSVIIEALRTGVKDSSGQLLTGAAALEFYRRELADTQGTAKRMAEILGDDMGGALKALRGAVSNAGVAFGSLFEGGFKTAIQDANLAIRGITQLFTQGGFSGDVKDALDKHVGIKQFAIDVFMTIKRIENFFTNLKASFVSTFEPFQPVLDLLKDTFVQLGTSLGFVNQTADQNVATWDSFGGVGAGVGALLANLAGAVLPVVITALGLIVAGVELARTAWDMWGGTIGTVAHVIGGAFRVIAGLFTGNWKMMWDGVVDIAAGAAKFVVHLTMSMVKGIAQAVDALGGLVGVHTNYGQAVDGFVKDYDAGNVEATTVLKSVVHAEPAAAKGAIEGQAKATTGAMMSVMPPAVGEAGEQHIHTHVTVALDNEKVGEAQAHARRSNAARSFRSVPAEGF